MPSFGLLEMHGLHRFDLVGLSQARGVLEQFLRTHLRVSRASSSGLDDAGDGEDVPAALTAGVLRCSRAHMTAVTYEWRVLVAFPSFHRLAVTYMRSTCSLRSDTAADKLEMHGPRGEGRGGPRPMIIKPQRRRFPARAASAMLSHLGFRL